MVILTLATQLWSQDLYFPPNSGNEWETISPDELNWCPDQIDALYDVLQENNTKAFIILKDGKIVLEKYFAPFVQDSIWYWASAGKSLTSLLVGMAQEEGFLDIHDPTIDYLGSGWTSCSDIEESTITVWNQLTMTTGLDDGVPDVDCYIDTCLMCLTTPGTRWAYHNAPYTLLSDVLASATGMTVNSFIQNKLTDLTGINGLFLPDGFNTVFFSKPRVMARFGLLMLNRGKWNNVDILSDTVYFNQMINTSQDLNKSYGYLWWLNGKESYMLPGIQFEVPGSIVPAAPDDMFAAIGKNGQFVNIIPSQNLVVVRMGNAPDNSQVPNVLLQEIWEQINQLDCTVDNGEVAEDESLIRVFPNPASGPFTVYLQDHTFSVSIHDVRGRLVRKYENCFEKIKVEEPLQQGLYMLSVETNGVAFYRRVIIM